MSSNLSKTFWYLISNSLYTWSGVGVGGALIRTDDSCLLRPRGGPICRHQCQRQAGIAHRCWQRCRSWGEEASGDHPQMLASGLASASGGGEQGLPVDVGSSERHLPTDTGGSISSKGGMGGEWWLPAKAGSGGGQSQGARAPPPPPGVPPMSRLWLEWLWELL